MRAFSVALSLSLSLCAASSFAANHGPIGPAVSPRGPGRVTVVWEGHGAGADALTLTAPNGTTRELSSASRDEVHRVEIDGLTPGVEYRYRSGDRAGSFVAPPDARQDVRFAVMGDARSGDDVHAALVAQIAAQRPDFYLSTGDVVPDGDSLAEWRTFFDIERPLLRTTPFATVRGNHDGHGALVSEMLSLRSDTPGATATYGSMDIGPAHFAMVDTEMSVAPGSPQYTFLDRDLGAHHGQPLFVVLHKPAFSTGRHGGTPAVHDALAPLFQRHGVDLVFQGHDHDYERTRPINGVTYVVTGGAGAILFGTSGGPWSAVRETSHHFLTVEASATRIRVRALRVDGSQLDAFEIDPRANDNGALAHAPLPAGGGGGPAMIFFGRGHDVTTALGSLCPAVALLAWRVRRRNKRKGRTQA